MTSNELSQKLRLLEKFLEEQIPRHYNFEENMAEEYKNQDILGYTKDIFSGLTEEDE